MLEEPIHRTERYVAMLIMGNNRSGQGLPSRGDQWFQTLLCVYATRLPSGVGEVVSGANH
eukprot:10851827-Prorocentrum_lima.AAC.1